MVYQTHIPSEDIQLLYFLVLKTSFLDIREYLKLAVADPHTFIAFKKAVSQLMQSQSLEEWKALDAISALIENLLKADCTIDKTALEKQLAEKTTPEEIIEVFKAFL